MALYNFRLHLVKYLKSIDYKVVCVCKKDQFSYLLEKEGISIIDVDINSTSINIIQDYKLYRKLLKLYKIHLPDVVINYTIKPHLYSTMAAKKLNIKVINFIAGVGSMFLNNGIKYRLVCSMYRFVGRRTDAFVFINNGDYNEFVDNKIIKNKAFIIDSEGIDINRFEFKIKKNKDFYNFIFIGRLVKEKGVYEYLEAAKQLSLEYNNVHFYVLGPRYKKKSSIDFDVITDYHKKGYIKYLNSVTSVVDILREMDVLVLPSYREGRPMVVLEALASGVLVMMSDCIGCADMIKDEQEGLLFNKKDVTSLVQRIKDYLSLDKDTIKTMINNGYILVENKHNSKDVDRKILEIISQVI